MEPDKQNYNKCYFPCEIKWPIQKAPWAAFYTWLNLVKNRIGIIQGAFNKFPAFFCTDIYRRLFKIHYVIAIHLMRWLTNSYDFRFKWTATAAIGIHPTKAWLSLMLNFKNAIWTSGHLRRTICKKFCFKLGKNATAMTQRPRDSFQWKHAGSPRPKKARQSKSTHKLLMIPFFDSTGMIYMHWVPTGQTVNKEYYVEVLREFRNRFRWKRPALFKSGQWHFHQDNAPVHNSILVTDYLTKMGINTVSQPPYSPDLVPCDNCLFHKLKENLRGCRYETIEEMK